MSIRGWLGIDDEPESDTPTVGVHPSGALVDHERAASKRNASPAISSTPALSGKPAWRNVPTKPPTSPPAKTSRHPTRTAG
jgi:hypothetical protein